MKFDVGEGFRITSDRYNWMFQEYRRTYVDKRDGKEKEDWETWGYWGTIDQLARCLPDHLARRLEGSDLSEGSEYMERIRDLQEALRSVREATTGVLYD